MIIYGICIVYNNLSFNIFLKGCLYYKVENRKILACVYMVDIIMSFYKFLLFPLSVFILTFENDFNIFKLLILLICLIVSFLGICKSYLIFAKKFIFPLFCLFCSFKFSFFLSSKNIHLISVTKFTIKCSSFFVFLRS